MAPTVAIAVNATALAISSGTVCTMTDGTSLGTRPMTPNNTPTKKAQRNQARYLAGTFSISLFALSPIIRSGNPQLRSLWPRQAMLLLALE